MSSIEPELSLSLNNLAHTFISDTRGELNSFIKAESQKKRAADLTKADFIPERIALFEKDFCEKIERNCKERSRKTLEENISRTFTNFTLSALKEERHEEYERLLDKYTKAFVDKKLKAFRAFETLGKIQQMLVVNDFQFIVRQTDLKTSFQISSAPTKDYANKLAIEERKSMAISNLKNKFLNKKLIEKDVLTLKIYDDLNELFIGMTEIEGFFNQIKFFIESSKCLNKSLEEIDENDLNACLPLSKKLAIEARKAKEEKADQAYRELMGLGSSQNTTFSNKQKINNGKTGSQKTHLQALVAGLNSSQSSYVMDSRILRWNTPNLSVIKGFTYFDYEKNSYVPGYADYSEQQLLEEKNRHNLTGIEKLISQPELLEKYSFSYKYFDTNSQSTKLGRGIYSVKVDQKGKKEMGIVYMGINNHLIYHAAFTPLNDKRFLPAHLIKILDSEKNVVDQEEVKIEQASKAFFSAIEDNIIQMQIGTKGSQVTYHFYPLK